MSYDAKCLELAEHFLSDEPDLKESAGEFAEAIQDFVEDWIDCARGEGLNKPKPPTPKDGPT